MATNRSKLQRAVEKVRSKLEVARLRPFDTSTEEGRAKERMRRVALTALASTLAKATSVSAALISVPLTIHYLGTERYGMWMVILSFNMLLTFADLGMGNGILNAVAHANGRDDTEEIRRVISSGYLILSTIAAGILAAFAASYSFISWPGLFNVHSEQASLEAGPAIAVFLVCFALAIPIGVVQRVQNGLQQGFSNGLWQCAGSLMSLVGILVVINYEAGLPWLVLAFAGAPLLAGIANTIVLFGFWRRDLLPSLRLVSLPQIKAIAQIGGVFVLLQLIPAVSQHADNLIIAQLLGVGAVASYAVPLQLFGVVGALLALALRPLWPAYAEAVARGDRGWIKSILKRSLKISIFCAFVMSAILVLAGQPIIAVWTGNAICPSMMVLLGLGVWKVIEAGVVALDVYLYGASAFTFLVLTATAAGALSFTMKLVLIPQIGVAGAIWSTIIGYLLCFVIPAYFYMRRKFR